MYTSQIQKARDSTRQTNIEKISAALIQYNSDLSIYPSKSDDIKSMIWTYLGSPIQDPRSGATCYGSTTCDYLYKATNDKNGISCGAYEISTGLEYSWNTWSGKLSESDYGNDSNRYESWISVSVINTDNKSGTATNQNDFTCDIISNTNPPYKINESTYKE